jgi:maltooligosyltrehalose trehalohydrolase
MGTVSTSSTRQLRTLGAVVDGPLTAFRVWAPEQRAVELVIMAAPAGAGTAAPPTTLVRVYPMRPESGGYWTATIADLPAGTLYKFRLNGREEQAVPDPASRYQPFGVHGPSAVVDPARFRWSDADWSPPAFDDLSIYELHVGAFTSEGTFRAVAERLPALVDLGVRAIELMPVADFPGNWNWGYDGVALFAPARCYGAPDDFRALIDAAHACGLVVFLDVVYNHFGPDGAYANAFSPYYFTNAHQSPWGKGVNLDGEYGQEVRRFFIENAVHWVREYHVDGLRLDATHAMVDDSPRHFLVELTDTVRTDSPKPVYFVAEDERNLARLLRPPSAGGYGLDAVWADDFHHEARVHTAGDRESYYRDFTGSTDDIARTLNRGWFFSGQLSRHQGRARGTDPTPLHPRQFVICIQNHDQVGNRADGARLHHHVDAAQYRALSALLLLAPATPMLFMGQEWAADTPFLFFTDHHEELGRLVTEGRRREFQSFEVFADPDSRNRIPDPQDPRTFKRSRLNWAELEQPAHATVRELYRRLLALRHSAVPLRDRQRGSFMATALDADTVMIDYAHRLIVIARLSGDGAEVAVQLPPHSVSCFSTEDAGVSLDPVAIVVAGDGADRVLRFSRPAAIVFIAAGGPESR